MKNMKNRRRLSNVPDRQGRLDVLLYEVMNRAAERLERERGLVGIREHVLPIIEKAILQNVPGCNLIPRELQELIKVVELNSGRRQ
jgi:hypothetical protein